MLFLLGLIARGCSTVSSSGDLADAGRVRFRVAVVGEETVHLLLHVGKLGVAEALDRRALQKGRQEGVVALEELLGVGHGGVPPSPIFAAEGYAAELGDQDRLSPV